MTTETTTTQSTTALAPAVREKALVLMTLREAMEEDEYHQQKCLLLTQFLRQFDLSCDDVRGLLVLGLLTQAEADYVIDALSPAAAPPAWLPLAQAFVVRSVLHLPSNALAPLFDQEGATCAVALDISGSMGSSDMCGQKKSRMECSKDVARAMTGGGGGGEQPRGVLSAVKSLLFGAGARTGTVEMPLLSRVIAWDDRALIMPLDKCQSNGGTNPSVVMRALHAGARSLLVTTDGEVPSHEVQLTRKELEGAAGLVNVVAVIVAPRKPHLHTVDLSVFFPFLEHCEKVGGCFALVHYDGSQAVLLMKRGKCWEKILPDPPQQYDETVTWDQVPTVPLELFASLKAPQKGGMTQQMLPSGQVLPPQAMLKWPVDFRTMSKVLKAKESLTDQELEQLDSLVTGCLLEIAQAAEGDHMALEGLRELVHRWKREKSSKAESKIAETTSVAEPMLREFEELTKRRGTPQAGADDPARLAELTGKLLPVLQERSRMKSELLQEVTQFHSSLLQELCDFEANHGGGLGDEQGKTQMPQDFSLKSVARNKVSNRAKRAVKVSAPEKQELWELEWGQPLLCPDCSICMRSDRVGALLLVGIETVDSDQAAFNLTDLALNDALSLGPRNAACFPAGSFCAPCAYACSALGFHPFTRQPVASVLVLGDARNNRNRKLMRCALSNAFFSGKELGIEWQVLLSLLDAVRDTGRFADPILDFLATAALTQSKANLFPEGMGTSLPLLEAMEAVVDFPLNELQPESWLVPLRNRTPHSLGLMLRSVMQHSKSDERTVLACHGLMRRIFIKESLSTLIGTVKSAADGQAKVNELVRMLESDLFDVNATGIPLVGSARVATLATSRTLLCIFWTERFRGLLDDLTKVAGRATLSRGIDAIAGPEVVGVLTLAMWQRLASGGVGSCMIKVEDLITTMVGTAGADSKRPLASVWFLNAAEPPTTESVLASVVSAAPYSGVHFAEGAHATLARFSPCHAFSPPVSYCGCCGLAFLSPEDWADLRQAKRVPDILQGVRDRRNTHFHEVFFTAPRCNYPTRTSAISSLHRVVREVLLTPAFSGASRPTRQMVVEVVEQLRAVPMERRGCIYGSELLRDIALLLWDWLQLKASLSTEQLSRLSQKMDVESRLVLEVAAMDAPPARSVITSDGLTQDELTALTAPLSS